MELNISEERDNAMVDFQLSQAFDIITFGEFFKGFELLQRWMIKHHFEDVDYSDMDLEAIDKEMMVDREIEQSRVEGGDEGEGLEEALVDPLVDPAANVVADSAVNLAV